LIVLWFCWSVLPSEMQHVMDNNSKRYDPTLKTPPRRPPLLIYDVNAQSHINRYFLLYCLYLHVILSKRTPKAAWQDHERALLPHCPIKMQSNNSRCLLLSLPPLGVSLLIFDRSSLADLTVRSLRRYTMTHSRSRQRGTH
jgi:hypothetical protein